MQAAETTSDGVVNEADNLRVGQRARVSGLAARPELNGLQGEIISEGNERLNLRLDCAPPGVKPVLCVRPKNLERLDADLSSVVAGMDAVRLEATPGMEPATSPRKRTHVVNTH
eukprot:1655725-Prymnesium_polylepis.1